jgi:hypothetical protein
MGDKNQIKKQEAVWNLLMTKEDHMFYRNQRPPIGYCTNFVCRKLEIKNMKDIKHQWNERSGKGRFDI